MSALFFDCSSREALVAEWSRDALQISCNHQPVQRGGLVVVVAVSGLPHKAIRRIGSGVPEPPPVFPTEAPIGFLVFKSERVLDAQQYVHSASPQAAQACLGWRSWGKDKHNHKHTTIDQQSEKVSNRAKLRFRRFETDQTSLHPLLSTHLNSTRTLASLPSIQKPTSFVPSSNSISLLTQFPFSFSFITSSFSTLLSSSS